MDSPEFSRSKVPLFTFSINLFKVYAIKNREILTCHEITIGKIDSDENDDEDEYDPREIWTAVQEVSAEYRFFIGKAFLSMHEVIISISRRCELRQRI